MIAEREDEPEEHAVTEMEGYMVDHDSLPDESLHALTGSLDRKTITVQGSIKGVLIKILIDTGASGSYLNSQLAQQLHLPTTSIDPITVTLANGHQVTSSTGCSQVKWHIQGYNFCFQFKVMDLAGWDMVLGVDWMYQFSPITFDFKQLQIRMEQEGEHYTLEGYVEQPTMHLLKEQALHRYQAIKSKELWRTQLQSLSESRPPQEVSPLPSIIAKLLEQYSVVFETPITPTPPH